MTGKLVHRLKAEPVVRVVDAKSVPVVGPATMETQSVCESLLNDDPAIDGQQRNDGRCYIGYCCIDCNKCNTVICKINIPNQLMLI